jgi:hypothetical protein
VKKSAYLRVGFVVLFFDWIFIACGCGEGSCGSAKIGHVSGTREASGRVGGSHTVGHVAVARVIEHGS